MIDAIKSEFRKLLTVRATYATILFALAITVLFAGVAQGSAADPATLRDPSNLMRVAEDSIAFVGLILAFAGLLLAGNEYRYTSIMYTLTATNRRWKMLLAKFVVITVFAVVTAILIGFFAPLCVIVGAHLHGKTLGHQSIDYLTLLWRCTFCGWAYAMYAYVLLLILRNQIGAIVTFLIVPLFGENILGLLLKKNTIYLPFNAAQSVANPVGLGNHTTSGHEVVVVLIYVVVGLAISTVLFTKRDAN